MNVSKALDLLIEQRNVLYPQGMNIPHPYVSGFRSSSRVYDISTDSMKPYSHPCMVCAQMKWHRLHQEENSK